MQVVELHGAFFATNVFTSFPWASEEGRTFTGSSLTIAVTGEVASEVLVLITAELLTMESYENGQKS